MSKVDDELTRRFRRAERPADGEALFEGLERRRSHRERLRKVQAGLLAFAVLAATSGGFVALRSAFDGGGRDVGDGPTLASNGEIVFVRVGGDDRSHIYATQPDGSGMRQITESKTNDADPDVSPDGRTVAFVRMFDEFRQRIATVPIYGGAVTHITEEDFHAADPAWSPDGTRLVYVTTGIDSQQLSTVDPAGREPREVIDFFGQLADPTWSADSAGVAFAARGYAGPLTSDSWDLATVIPGASEARIEPDLARARKHISEPTRARRST
jgi:dipeptidyl aminopeptidase/acylaminoacyl peptidase